MSHLDLFLLLCHTPVYRAFVVFDFSVRIRQVTDRRTRSDEVGDEGRGYVWETILNGFESLPTQWRAGRGHTVEKTREFNDEGVHDVMKVVVCLTPHHP